MALFVFANKRNARSLVGDGSDVDGFIFHRPGKRDYFPGELVERVQSGLIRRLQHVRSITDDQCILRSVIHAFARALGRRRIDVPAPTHGVPHFANECMLARRQGSFGC